MALKASLVLSLYIPCLFLATVGRAFASRDLPDVVRPGHDLAARLEGGRGGMADCWTALVELKSCSSEIVLFFLNGETVIGPECCRAIEIITHNCWPAMLASLGFTSEEGNILRGYCDAASSPVGSPSLYSIDPVAIPNV
ncbi:hypothetical protein MLD38_009343 [Melastoma candidum]|uniref:Uncharacterized protein n=1 Tax=Melastoma candidum TaxID=119954 RepID=A0ACB9S5R4_9MYRT|nr:hypothetical protein MLD38_009343 [Melastoma candidum]